MDDSVRGLSSVRPRCATPEEVMRDPEPKPESDPDERLAIPLELEETIRVLLAVDPDSEPAAHEQGEAAAQELEYPADEGDEA